MDGNIAVETERGWDKTEGDGRKNWEGEAEGLTAGADVALVAVEEAVSDPDVRPRGRVA